MCTPCSWPWREIRLITPPIAPEPYSAAIGPRMTSMRSTSASVSTPKLNAPEESEASFSGMPSRSTRTPLELVPRTNTLALPPGPPDWLTRTPGMADNASVSLV